MNAVFSGAFSRRLACFSVLLGLLSGCASPPPPKPVSYVVLLPNDDGVTGKVTVTGEKGRQLIELPRTGAPLDGSLPPSVVDPEKFQRDFAAVLAARPRLPAQFLLYFETGGANLTAESQALLPLILADVLARPAADVSIIGHTDTVGKEETNEALALKRAEAVSLLLTARGMSPIALTVDSHGERNLLVPTPDETAEPRNRRVEVSVR